jgi:parvulin-like peptidyl-prolyl isomerase
VELAKKKQQKPKREMTKRQLSRWQQQKRRQRIIFGSGIFIIVAALVTIGVGWYTTRYQPMHETIATVNDTSFNMRYYINMLKYYGQGQSTDYLFYLADEVLAVIERNELARQGALKLGISVSNDEVDEELKRLDPPLSKEYRDIVRTDMLVTKLEDEYFEHQVPLFAEQRHVLAMLLENENQATEVKARLDAGEDFTELAGELSLEAISQTKNGDLGWHPKDVLAELLQTSIPADYAFDAQLGVLSQPIYDEEKTKSAGYWLIKVSEREEDSDLVYVKAILLGNEEEAQSVRARLEADGDFAALAKELSQHEGSRENGGDIGWLTPGTMHPAFDEFVFNSEVELDTLSEPIRDDTVSTTGGYWLVKVLDKDDNRKIEDDDRTLLKSKALNDWVSSLWDDPENKIESYLDDDKKSWAILKAMGELEQ